MHISTLLLSLGSLNDTTASKSLLRIKHRIWGSQPSLPLWSQQAWLVWASLRLTRVLRAPGVTLFQCWPFLVARLSHAKILNHFYNFTMTQPEPVGNKDVSFRTIWATIAHLTCPSSFPGSNVPTLNLLFPTSTSLTTYLTSSSFGFKQLSKFHMVLYIGSIARLSLSFQFTHILPHHRAKRLTASSTRDLLLLTESFKLVPLFQCCIPQDTDPMFPARLHCPAYNLCQSHTNG